MPLERRGKPFCRWPQIGLTAAFSYNAITGKSPQNNDAINLTVSQVGWFAMVFKEAQWLA